MKRASTITNKLTGGMVVPILRDCYNIDDTLWVLIRRRLLSSPAERLGDNIKL